MSVCAALYLRRSDSIDFFPLPGAVDDPYLFVAEIMAKNRMAVYFYFYFLFPFLVRALLQPRRDHNSAWAGGVKPCRLSAADSLSAPHGPTPRRFGVSRETMLACFSSR